MIEDAWKPDYVDKAVRLIRGQRWWTPRKKRVVRRRVSRGSMASLAPLLTSPFRATSIDLNLGPARVRWDPTRAPRDAARADSG